MSRPKSAGGSSFLDELLGNDQESDFLPSSSRNSARQRKSVRFFDEDEPTQKPDPPSNRPRSARPHSSMLDSLLEPTANSVVTTTPRPSTGTAVKSKSDWLGINDSGSDSSRSHTDVRPLPTERQSSTATLSPASTNKSSSTSEPDWIAAGLKARQSRQSEQQQQKPSFLQTEDSSTKSSTSEPTISSIKPLSGQIKLPISEDNHTSLIQNGAGGKRIVSRISESAQPTTSTKESEFSPIISSTRNDSELLEQSKNDGNKISEHQIDLDSSMQSSSSITFLQTKLRMVTLEKQFLEQTVEQMKRNHQDELNAMILLYEQQMRLTSEMYKRHESMIQEERDRRIMELKSQLETSERELDGIRNKYKEHLANIEEEYRTEKKRIQESYAQTIKQLEEQHQNELQRLEERLRAENETTIETQTDLVKHQTKSVSELLAKWEESAFKIEKLQRSMIAKQEELAREQMLNSADDVLATKIRDIEAVWKSFVEDMQRERAELELAIRSEHEMHREKDETKIKMMEQELINERHQLEEMRQRFANEVNEWREKESIEAEKLLREREQLKHEVTLFEERRSLLETLYNERKQALDDERNRLAKQNDELIRRISELEQKESQVMTSMVELETRQQQWQIRKQRFEEEKKQMAQLGQSLAKRAEELEKLSQMALKEKMNGIEALDEIERLRSMLKNESDELEKAKAKIQIEQHKLAMERNRIDQQFRFVQELKDSIVCNLCGSALNRGSPSLPLLNGGGKESNQDPYGQIFCSLINGGYFMRQQSNAQNNRMSGTATHDQDGDKTLLFWQMAAQQDAASLAEETNFLKILIKNQKSKDI